eukprot:gene3871-4134_t
MSFIDVPEEIYPLLKSFLSQDDYHFLMNASKGFAQIKQQTVYYSLTDEKSEEFCTSETFRNKVLSQVKSPQQQISLTLASSVLMGILLQYPVHTVTTCGLDDVTFPLLRRIKVIRILSASASNLYQSINFSEIEMLFMPSWINCFKSEPTLSCLSCLEINDCSALVDVSILSNIPILKIRSCPLVKDFSSLGPKQVELEISDTPYLTDVRSFATVKHLTLHQCESLEDISFLKNVHHLDIFFCYSLKDLWKLKGHTIHKLKLSDYYGREEDYATLRDIPYIQLAGCNIRNVSIFANSIYVELISCNEVIDLSALSRVKQLAVRNCRQVKEFTLHTNRCLSLGNFTNLQLTYPPVSIESTRITPKTLCLESCHITTDQAPFLLNYHFLRFSRIKEISSILRSLTFFQLHKIEIINCDDLIEVKGLENVHTVSLQSCSYLRDIRCLGRGNHTVSLIACISIEDISSLRDAQVVTIIECRGIIDYSSLKSVPRKKIIRMGKSLL